MINNGVTQKLSNGPGIAESSISTADIECDVESGDQPLIGAELRPRYEVFRLVVIARV